MTDEQVAALKNLCERHGVEFDPKNFQPVFDLPAGWVAGWVGDRIYVGCSPEGDIHS